MSTQQQSIPMNINFVKQISSDYKKSVDQPYRSALSTILYVNLSTLTTQVNSNSSNWLLQISSLR